MAVEVFGFNDETAVTTVLVAYVWFGLHANKVPVCLYYKVCLYILSAVSYTHLDVYKRQIINNSVTCALL